MAEQSFIRKVFFLLSFLGCASIFAGWSGEQEPAPSGGASPEEIARYERELARRIVANRAGAERGDLLTPELTKALQNRFRALIDGEKGAAILAAIKEMDVERSDIGPQEEPLLAVNEVYPEDAVLRTMPPQVLDVFPKLPDGVEYRFVGCRLMLLERGPRIILDYTEECFW